MITVERKTELEAKGYCVEHIADEWGFMFMGQYRWVRKDSDEFQDGCVSYNIVEAWESADRYDKQCVHPTAA